MDTLVMTGEVDFQVLRADEFSLGDLAGVGRIDMSGVDRLDSAAIALVLRCLQVVRQDGRPTQTLTLTGTPEPVRATLDMMGVIPLLHLTD